MNQARWYGTYKAALVECDPAKLPTRIREAEIAIYTRIKSLAKGSDPCHERELISGALFGLRTLQKPVLRHL